MNVHRVFKRCKDKLLATIVTFSFLFALDMNFSVSAETLQKNYLDTKGKSNPTETEKNTEKISAPARSSGMKVFKDPETGEFTTTHDSSDVPSAHALEVNTSSEGLVQTQAPKGGIMINLQGRFRSFMSATKDPNGKLSVSCSQAHTSTAPGDVK